MGTPGVRLGHLGPDVGHRRHPDRRGRPGDRTDLPRRQGMCRSPTRRRPCGCGPGGTPAGQLRPARRRPDGREPVGHEPERGRPHRSRPHRRDRRRRHRPDRHDADRRRPRRRRPEPARLARRGAVRRHHRHADRPPGRGLADQRQPGRQRAVHRGRRPARCRSVRAVPRLHRPDGQEADRREPVRHRLRVFQRHRCATRWRRRFRRQPFTFATLRESA